MNRISVSFSTRQYASLAQAVRKALRLALINLKKDGTELSLRLTSDVEITRLNHIYRKKNRPTDVLSFTQEENDLLGDIVISIPTARRQAKTAGHPLERECSILAIHGLLHLLGYDHEKVSQEKRMFDLQNRLLRKWENRD